MGEATGSRTLFLVEDVEQNDADFVVGLNLRIQQHGDDVLHGVFKRLALRVGAHGQILHGGKKIHKQTARRAGRDRDVLSGTTTKKKHVKRKEKRAVHKNLSKPQRGLKSVATSCF